MFKKPLAPNDPKRVPKEHRELINSMYNLLTNEGYNVFEAQIITQALSVLRVMKGDKFLQAAHTIQELAERIDQTKDGKEMMEAILQILGYKMQETLNELSLDTLQFKEL